MNELNELNSLYKYSLLFEGKFENNKINYNKFRSICIELVNLITNFVVLSHLIIFITDNDILKDHLIYFKLSDEDFGSRFLNLGAGISIIALKHSLTVFKSYSKKIEHYLPLSFLFCFDKKEMSEKYHLSKLRAAKQVRLQFILLKFTKIHRLYYLSFSAFIFKNCYDNVMKTSFDEPFQNYLINSIKIIGYIWFSISYFIIVNAGLIITNEFLLSFKYLDYRLNDQMDDILKLATNKIKNKRQFNKKLNEIFKNYNMIIKNRSMFNRHFDRSLNYSSTIICLTFVFLAVLLNNPNNSKFVIYFFSIDYIICYSFLGVYCYFNYIFLDANNKFWNDLSFLVKYADSRLSNKILNVYILNNQLDVFSFNYRSIHQYTWNFLLFLFLESTSLEFLLYQANQLK